MLLKVPHWKIVKKKYAVLMNVETARTAYMTYRCHMRVTILRKKIDRDILIVTMVMG
jgi:hypothetical protein